MSNLAEKLELEELFLQAATVIRVDGADVTVTAGAGQVVTRRATMCLVEPAVGDRVMVAAGPGESFVVGVLAREQSEGACLSLDKGDLRMRVPNGRLEVTTKEGVAIHTAGEVSTTAPRWSLNALEGHVLVGKLRLLSNTLRAELGTAGVVAEVVDTVVDRIRQRVQQSYRFVKDSDQLRAGHIDHRAKGVARIHADNAVMTANKLAKIDGEQIHVG